MTMYIQLQPLTPPGGDSETLRRFYSLSPWERVGVRASVASPVRCRRLRIAIGSQRKAHCAANTERIGKRCNAAMRFEG